MSSEAGDSFDKKTIGHKYKPKMLYFPSICTACHTFIFGLFNQGLCCELCGNVIHHKCLKNVKTNCTKIFPPMEKEHKMEPTSMFSASFCDHCGSSSFGRMKQCANKNCGCITHKDECSTNLGGPCGINPHQSTQLCCKLFHPISFALILAITVPIIVHKLK